MYEKSVDIEIEEEEYWWCGAVDLCTRMPFSRATEIRFDLVTEPMANQLNPLFLSSKGRWVWMDKPGYFCIHNGVLHLESPAEMEIGREKDLRSAYLRVCGEHFPPTGELPPRECFEKPIYCTWMEMFYDQNQQGVLEYAEKVLQAGLPAGVLILDDGWEEYYGFWDFNKRKFPDAKEMCDKLRAMGFTPVVWIVPYVSPDSDAFRDLNSRGLLLSDSDGKPFLSEWWNGVSAVLDLTNPEAEKWFEEQYLFLHETYGIEGLKLDGGDARFYPKEVCGAKPVPSYEHTRLYAEAVPQAPIRELRACFKNGLKPVLQRVCDRRHCWEREDGLGGLPDRMIVQGLSGYVYDCPDMVGGGLIEERFKSGNLDEELLLRFVQLSVLMPVVQFSKRIWEYSPKVHRCVKQMLSLREKIMPDLKKLAEHAARTGEPILRSIVYEYGVRGDISDEFLIGRKYLVAPVLHKGVRERKVYLPTGRWKDWRTGLVYEGDCEVMMSADPEDLPVFVSEEQNENS